MYTVNLKTSTNKEIFTSDGGASEYYIKLIIKEISECLNSNGISYYTGNDEPDKNSQDSSESVILTVEMSSSPGPLPGDKTGIYIFFNAGNSESKRMAEIFENNIKNLYHSPQNVRIISNDSSKIDDIPGITISVGYTDSPEDMEWLKNNIDLISKSLVASLCEYFKIPFVGCESFYIGTANSDASVYDKPSLNSQIVGSVESNSKVNVLGQWENWYIIGKNHKLGYIQTQFINIWIKISSAVTNITVDISFIKL